MWRLRLVRSLREVLPGMCPLPRDTFRVSVLRKVSWNVSLTYVRKRKASSLGNADVLLKSSKKRTLLTHERGEGEPMKIEGLSKLLSHISEIPGKENSDVASPSGNGQLSAGMSSFDCSAVGLDQTYKLSLSLCSWSCFESRNISYTKEEGTRASDPYIANSVFPHKKFVDLSYEHNSLDVGLDANIIKEQAIQRLTAVDPDLRPILDQSLPVNQTDKAIRLVARATSSLESETNERLLIHISYSPKRWACRTCAVALVDLRPCDFKMSKLLAMLQTYRCMYGFDIRIPVFQDLVSTSSTFKNVLRNAISRHTKELQSARALFDGKLIMENQQVTSEGLHNVELLLPFKSDVQHGSSDDIAGLVVFRGAICAYAYLSPKEPALQAISDLKNDIINSLKSRLDIVLDEGEDTLNMASSNLGNATGEIVTGKPIHELILHELRKPLVLSFPRRVLVPWLPGIFICDYLLPSETFEDLKDRCRELLSMQTPLESSGLLELETEAVATSSITSSFWDVVRGNPISSNGETERRSSMIEKKSSKKSKYFDFYIQIGLFVLLVAVLIGGSITVFSPVKI